MMLPSIEVLKDQAARLITYLGDKHRVKLKRSAALEAIAAINRCPDWNTAHALAARGAEPPRKGADDGKTTYPLLWSNGLPALAISRQDWSRHVIALHASRPVRQEWLRQQLHAQLARGGGGIWLNAFGQGAAIADAYAGRIQVLDMAQSAQNPDLNILVGLAPHEVADLICDGLLPESDGNPGADYYRQASHYALEVMVSVLQGAGQPVTASAIQQLMEQPTRAYRLVAKADGPLGAAVVNLLTSHETSEGFSQQSWTNLVGGLIGRLSLLSGAGLSMLFSDKADAPGLGQLLASARPLVVEMNNQDTDSVVRRQGCLLVSAIRAAIRQRTSSGEHPMVIGLGDAERYICRSMLTLAEQGRGFAAVVMATSPDEKEFAKSWLGSAVLQANTWNRLHLGGLSESAAYDLAQTLTRSAGVLQQTDTIRWAPAP